LAQFTDVDVSLKKFTFFFCKTMLFCDQHDGKMHKNENFGDKFGDKMKE